MSEARDSILNLLGDMLAIQMAARLDQGVRLPKPETVRELRTATTDSAEKLLNELEKDMLVHTVRDIIIKDVRNELLRRTTAARVLDIGINVSAFVAAILIGVVQFLFVREVNLDAISVSYWIILAIIIFQFLGNLYLRHLDR
jgi:hypothetical protein